ncbi:MAG TPA: hypothetical protein VGM10_14430 [Actinocrinis sp.]|jgi:hypothetical protein
MTERRRVGADGDNRPRRRTLRRHHPLAVGVSTTITLLMTACCSCVNNPGPSVVICGTVLDSGEAAPRVSSLPAPEAVAHPGPPPKHSQLPATQPPHEEHPEPVYLRTSRSCTTGAIVIVTPVADARLFGIARADDGNIAAIVFTVVNGPVTVSAWQDEKLTGIDVFNPT